jgi:hypothetical protein
MFASVIFAVETLVGTMTADVLETPIVVGKVPNPVGAAEIPMVRGMLEDPVVCPRIVERRLPSPIESELEVVLAAADKSVGVDVVSNPVDGAAPLDEPVIPSSEERGSGAGVDVGAEESKGVVGEEIPIVKDRAEESVGSKLLKREISRPVVAVAAADDAAAGKLVTVGARLLVVSDTLLLGASGSEELGGMVVAAAADEPTSVVELGADEEAGNVVAAAPDAEVPLDEPTIPPGATVIALPVGTADEGWVISGSSVVVEVVGRTMTDGAAPDDTAGEVPCTPDEFDSSGSLALAVELGATTMVCETITVVTPSLLPVEELVEDGVG